MDVAVNIKNTGNIKATNVIARLVLSNLFILDQGLLEYNIAEDIYLKGGSYIGIGPGPRSSVQPGSEFGSYPNIFYGSFRYYF